MTGPTGIAGITEEVVRSAVDALFMTMAGTEPRFIEVRLLDEFFLAADVTGIMYLAGDSPGLIACGVSAELGRSIIGKMTGQPEEGLGERDVLDGLAEVVNIIAGHIKTRCPEMGISLTPPLALSGTGCALTWKTNRRVTSLHFDVNGERFNVVAAL